MSFSSRRMRRVARVKRSVITTLIIWTMVLPLSLSQAKLVAEGTTKALNSVKTAWNSRGTSAPRRLQSDQIEGPSQRAARTQHIKLCPRKVSLHVEEGYALVPVPLDQNRQTVHGAQMTWSSNNPSVASVASYGEVEAKSPGRAVITVQIGNKRANVTVEVEAGVRPRISDAEWERRHRNDCDDPEALGVESVPANQNEVRASGAAIELSLDARSNLTASRPEGPRDSSITSPTKMTLRHATLSAKGSASMGGFKATRASLVTPRPKAPVPQGGESIEIFPQATSVQNVVGSPRFSPLETTDGATKLKNNLGSSNYGFAAPALSLGGRGVGVSLSLIYNAQLWNKDESGVTPAMRFNYNRGMIAEGWNIGYGRIICNYDGDAQGDGSSVGLENRPGSCLLIQGDGTRIHFVQRWDSVNGVWNLESDGEHTFFNPRNFKLRYNDGTLVRYFVKNNKLLPNEIKTRNGDVIAMEYRDHDPVIFPNRFSLDRITDTLGRIIQFYYYGDAGYPADPANGKPLAALAAIKTPDLLNGQPREVVRVEYQTLTLQYNFNSNFTIDGPANNSPITVVKRIYYPATGRGYLFLDYSTYGMCRQISVRKDMTGTGGVITDGTEVAYTKYNFPNAIDGGLNRAPEYTSRKEWWQGHPSGSSPTEFTYSRSHGSSTETDTVTEVMPVTGTLVDTVTTSTNGQVESVVRKVGETVLSSATYAYDFGDPNLLGSISITNEAAQTAATSYEYSTADLPYGRVTKMYESDFGLTSIRRTEYGYSDAADHLSVNLIKLVTNVAVFDHQTNEKKQKLVFTYDDYAGAMQTYASMPTTHDSSFDTAYTKRGNVTGVQTFSSISPPVSTTRLSKFDIFGNNVEAEVGCCQVKTFAFSLNTTWYSQPDTVTNGRIGVAPYVTTAYSYDFNTGLVTQMTDPDNGITGYQYDTAWRLLTVSTPTGAQVTTSPDRTNGNDQLSYVESVTYPEGQSSKTITKRSWFDGAGRVLRQGAGAGPSPTTYDAVATEYDALGRVSRMSNPYLGNDSGIGTPTSWTSNEYDNLSRVKKVTLADQQTIQTEFNGSETTVTDQVGRKKRSVVDGLGRLVGVTEQDTTTGSLTVTTSYSYNAVDNLLEINQDGQIRSFIYDALSRVKSETTPEGGTATFTYTDFDALLKRTHQARGVETHYKYDSLNRTSKVWYTGLEGDDLGTIRPALPSSVAATSDLDITYGTSAPGNGQVLSVTDGQITGFSSSESYTYESLTGRVVSKTRVIDGNSYQTQYQYNGISQVTLMIYPSGKRVRMNYDSRGRMSGEDKVDAAGMALTNYVSSIGYNVAGQVTGMTLGSGVTESYSYSNDRLQLTRQTATKSANTLMDLNYSYAATAGASGAGTTAGNSGQLMAIANNPSSQPSTINQQNRNQSFTYDNVARLKTASGWSTWSQSYGYDNKNNLTSVSGTQPKTISVDSATNRIQNVNGTVHSYDAAGNLTSDGIHNYKYDAAGRLAMVDAGTGNEVSYYYDFQNWRVKKVFASNTTNYIWEEGRVIAEYGSGQPQGPGGIKYYHPDRLSTRATTDSSGAVVSTQDHLPFGEDISTTGQPEKHRFTSYERDNESNTDHAINRQYAMGSGRFMQADVWAGSTSNPQSLNRYAYVASDPINSVDPEGLFPIISFSFGNFQMNVQAQYDLIVLIPSVGPIVAGDVLPVISIDVLALLPPLSTPRPQNPCHDKIAKIFGGPDAVGGGHAARPGNSNPDPKEAGKMHVYGDKDARKNVDVSIPAGAQFLGQQGKENAIYAFYYENLGSKENLTLVIMHIADYNPQRQSDGQIRVGRSGGPGGTNNLTEEQTLKAGIPFYNHVHVEAFGGRRFPQKADRARKRILPSDIFCK
ncbi:MAG: RHS repeat-associated core domain-containing protein [Acidobacteriota bacterium]